MTHFSLPTHDPFNSMILKNNSNNMRKQKKGFVPSTSRAKIRVYRRKNREEEE